MIIVSGTTDFCIDQLHKEDGTPLAPYGTAVAIGKFDGVHRGHKMLISELLKARKKEGLVPVIFTFDPSPEIFFGHGPERELSTKQEKRRLFEKLGVELLVEFPFNKETAATPPVEFIEKYLVKMLHAGLVAAGTDLSFGDKGKGNFEILSYMAERYGYRAQMISKAEYNGQVISSTLVRSLVAEGKMEDVTYCLGAPYAVLGQVKHGNRIGRRIDIPTVNQMPESTKLLPPFGVYFSTVEVGGAVYNGMTNIGVKPSVTDGKSLTVETYLYDFEGDLYDKEIVTSLLTYRRPEKKFSGLLELKEAMQADIAAGREYFRSGKRSS